MNNFDKICNDIKEIKIQGAENVAKAALKALRIKSDENSIKKLISLRDTEPALRNAIKCAMKYGIEEAEKYFDWADKTIIPQAAGLVKNKTNIYTHCHSSHVTRILEFAKKKGKDFTVYNTETRPLFQGRRTSLDLANSGIKNIHLVDSAMLIAIKNCDLVLLGANAITEKYVTNKVGSGLVALAASQYNVPIYICTDGWKFSKDEVKIEQRSSKEIWETKSKVNVLNPAFENIPGEYIKGVVSEFGILSFSDFVKKVKKEYKWMFR